MPPSAEVSSLASSEQVTSTDSMKNLLEPNPARGFVEEALGLRSSLIWYNIVYIAILHLCFLYALVTFPFICKFQTLIFGLVCFILAGFGVTGGAHRLWSHNSYKAKLPLRIFFLIFFAMAGENTVLEWVKDHRVHHKYTETDADPHNAKRGFFFSHVGWLMMRKHPDVIKKGKQLNYGDLLQDPVVMFHERHFAAMQALFCFVIPTLIPHYCWDETWFCSFAQTIVRYCLILNGSWTVNSVAHLWGSKPCDKRINATENTFVSVYTFGEGWHNYHHVFPWDYRASELMREYDLTTFFINCFATIGWAYDLREPSNELVMKTAAKYGDGSLQKCYNDHQYISKE